MQEFMFYIRNTKEAKLSLTESEHLAFIKRCEVYINDLKKENKLIAAQPLIREGVIVSKAANNWNEKNICYDKEIQVGYYHIRAVDINEAIKIAKENPEFEYVPSASIEVRPIKTKEIETGFEYPVNQ